MKKDCLSLVGEYEQRIKEHEQLTTVYKNHNKLIRKYKQLLEVERKNRL